MYSGYVETISSFDQGMLDDAQIIDTTLLPPEYMPLYYSPNPWNKFAAIEEDFIVIAEFSELEGPKPLISIPNNSNNDGFDLNSFVLKIMSVDHQSTTSKFCMPRDAQVVLDESKEGVYAYVHHFTLHDSQARGFVRPFCMAYVTPDSRKIMTFFEDIQRLFQQVSKNFKYGNLKLFYKDMKHYLADLEFTKAKLEQFKKQPKQRVEQMTEEELILNESCDRSIDNIIYEIREIIEVIQPLLDEDQRLCKKFRMIEDRAFLREKRTSTSAKSSFVESASFDGNSSSHIQSQTKEKIRRSSSFGTDIVNVSMEDYGSYKPSLVRLHRRRFDKALRTLHELSLWGAKEGINGLRNILRYFRRDTATLLIEKKDSELTDPPSCLLTIGQCVTINFLFSTDGADSASSWGLKDPTTDRSGCSPEKLARWLSTDTLESFKSAESFFSVRDDCEFVKSGYEPKFVAAGNPCSEQRRSLVGDGDSNSFEIISTPSDEEIFVEASSSFSNQHELNEAIKVATLRPADDSPCDEYPSQGGDSAYSDNFHHVGKKIKIPVISSAEHVNNLEPTSPGYGILKFVNTHNYSHHLFASMLMGRPVVVIGKLERDVKDALTTLGLFVPGYSSRRKTVVLSQNQPLKITDLSKLTLIGLIKPEKKSAEHLVPESIKRYVTVLDLDKKNLFSPEYEGGVLKKVLKLKKVFMSDEAYLAFIHCEQFPPLLNQSLKVGELTKSYDFNRENDKQLVEFLADLGVENGDIPIVKYFAEIIQIQQTDDFYTDKRTGLPDKPAPSVRLDYRQTNVFK
ncbi:uncharacterized protein LOC135488102 isoform X2 [Lineus longissimus]|uniref:uncharacterized protein LOC135488102 isoform X2 n=1 Tax=Lineus longissimus TaxID=88925 RepID=UPI00315D744A